MTRNSPIPETMTLHVPFRFVKRGGRKEMQMPDAVRPDRKADSTLVKALARAFRWKRMLESGEFSSISEMAEKEDIAFTYIARVMRLTLLSPAIVDGIVAGRQPANITLANLMDPFPPNWHEQHALWNADNALD